MNIIHALESKKPFKRPSWGQFYTNIKQIDVTREDLLATDWVLESDKKLISAEDIRKAYDLSSITEYNTRMAVERIIKKLGLE